MCASYDYDNVVLNSAAVDNLFETQLHDWEQARNNYLALKNVKVKSVRIRVGNGDGKEKGFPMKVQFNPARIVSSAAKVDSKSIKERKCFLCAENRPEVQRGINYHGVMTDYTVLVNPFPIFPMHLTIPCTAHSRQQLDSSRLNDMMSLAKILKKYVLFYNGPRCGASAPDHFHFQAGSKGFLPLEARLGEFTTKEIFKRGEYSGNMSSVVPSDNFIRVSLIDKYVNGAFLVEAAGKKSAIAAVGKIYSAFSSIMGVGKSNFDPAKVESLEGKVYREGEWEPMMNVLCWYEDGTWYLVVFTRSKHRPSCYSAEGEENILISPASVDMGGVFITPLEKDFRKIGAKDIENILDEISVSKDIENQIVSKLQFK